MEPLTSQSGHPLFEHHCTICGHRGDLLPEDGAYEPGWDAPPRIGIWGLLTPRTCPGCGTRGTLTLALVAEDGPRGHRWQIIRKPRPRA